LSYPASPGFKENTTSKEAAEAVAPDAATMRASALFYLGQNYPGGFTADEVASGLGLSVLSIRPRISELNNAGKIERTGERRKNQSGHSAIVWRVKAVQ